VHDGLRSLPSSLHFTFLHTLSHQNPNPGPDKGIPGAKFIENVEQFLKDESIESALGALNELYSKYKYMEGSFEKTKNVYKGKIPELEQTLEIVKLMKSKEEDGEEMYTNYSLCDTIYAKAKIDLQADRVALYIGAKSFLEYSLTEAADLLVEQLEQSAAKLAVRISRMFTSTGRPRGMPCRINRPYSMSCPVMSCHAMSRISLLTLFYSISIS